MLKKNQIYYHLETNDLLLIHDTCITEGIAIVLSLAGPEGVVGVGYVKEWLKAIRHDELEYIGEL